MKDIWENASKLVLGLMVFIILVQTVSAVVFETRINPFTRQLDYYTREANNVTNLSSVVIGLDNGSIIRDYNISWVTSLASGGDSDELDVVNQSMLDNVTIIRTTSNVSLGYVIGVTTNTYTGNFTGSAAGIGFEAGDQICQADFPTNTDVHMCSQAEVRKTFSSAGIGDLTDNFWYANSLAFTTEGDCQGFSSNTSTDLGPFWSLNFYGSVGDGVGSGRLTACSNVAKIGCCGS